MGPGGFASMRQRGVLLDRMQRQLYLSATQRERIDQILRESHEHMRALWDSIAPKAQLEQRRVRELIRAELNPEQQKQFEEVFKPRQGHPGEEHRRWGERRDSKATPSDQSTNSPAGHDGAAKAQ
jgi:hypothetical protein